MGFAQTPESAGRGGLAGRDGVRAAAWITGNMSATVTRSLRAFPGLTPPAGVPATATDVPLRCSPDWHFRSPRFPALNMTR